MCFKCLFLAEGSHTENDTHSRLYFPGYKKNKKMENFKYELKSLLLTQRLQFCHGKNWI